MKWLLATIALCLASTAVAEDKDPVDESTGLLFQRSKTEYRLVSYKDVSRFRFSTELFHYENEKKVTKLSGIGIGMGLKLIKSDWLDVLAVGSVNGGIAQSPKQIIPKCDEPVYKPDPVKEIATDKDEKVREYRQQYYDAKYKQAKSGVEYENSLAKTNYDICKSQRKTAEDTSQYGFVSYYEYGAQPTIKLGHLVIGGFAGKRIERKQYDGNKGDLDLTGLNYRFFIGLDW